MPKLTMPEPATRAEETVTLDSSPTMAMTSLYGAAIGLIGSDYYLPIFSRFEARGQGTLSWNWSACLYSLNWMIFRGLWGAALAAAGALLGAVVLLVALGKLMFDWPPEMLMGVLLACLALFCLVPGAWGNALLYNHSRAAMMTAVANNKTLTQACAELSQHAASRARFVRLLAVNAALAAAAAVAYVTFLGNDSPARPAPEVAPALVRASSPASAASDAASAAAPVASAPDVATSVALAASVTVADSDAADASAPEAASSASTAAMAQASEATSEAPVSKAAAPASSAAPAKPTAGAVPTREFYVHAGLFANPANADQVMARLKTMDLPAVSLELNTGQGPRTRVRVGPFATRAQAELAVRHIKAMNLDAVLAKP